jgi:hypothetical protein
VINEATMNESNRPPACVRRLAVLTLGTLTGAWVAPVQALETKVGGLIAFGSNYRTEAQDTALLNTLNGAAAGLRGMTSAGANADDANTNFRRNDATSTALKAYLDLSLSEGAFSALLRLKAWRDFALLDQPRAWGNVANGYAAGQPLSDRGAPPLSRFSGVALGDYYVQTSAELGGTRLFGRVGQQSLSWGERAGFGGGLEALNAKDLPAIRRPGAVPQETKVPVPALFGRAELSTTLGVEGFYQMRFRPTAVDMCGTFWSLNDYLVDGCDKVMSGQPITNDRLRVQNGAYIKRLPTPQPGAGGQFGLALTWKSDALATDFGLYHAHTTSRTLIPSLRKSTRVGPALIAGDPQGQNLAFFTEYPEAIRLTALTFAHKHGATNVYGELSYRPNQPLQLSPGDVIGAFLSPTSASLLRADANALAPGALFHGFDRYAVTQAQLGVQQDWSIAGGVKLGASAEVVAKFVGALPDQALRRYGRADIFGAGPINGVCVVNTPDPVKQCSQGGYVTRSAYAYRLRLDARRQALLPELNGHVALLFVHDVKGWSSDLLLNQGRKSANLALRFEYRQRYLAEIVYAPIWGGDYNAVADRDQVSLSVGVKF